MNLTFDESLHQYRLDGRPVPSVTQIVRAVIPRQYEADAWCMQRGTMVHRAVAMMLRGMLDWSSVDPRILPRVRAAEKYQRDSLQGVPLRIEQPAACALLGYAGTPDLVAGKTVIDWKSSPEPEAEIQLGGYACALQGHGIPVTRCVCVELREDGTYHAETYDARRCIGLFLNVHTVYQWMKANGRLPKKGE